jgi:hypothetical protein
MSSRVLVRTFLAFSALAFLVGCAEMEPSAPVTTAPAPPPPQGYWNGDGVPGSPKIVVSLAEQKAYFYKGKHLVGESTISSGKPGFGTPPGQYTVLSKDATHVSTVFGDYVDEFGNVTKSNIDVRKDSKPPGSHYDGARMPFAMFFRGGYAMHQGYVPPYAASHGCIRVPQGMAETFFDNAPVGTPVIVKEDAVMPATYVPPLNPAPAPPAPMVLRPTTVPPSVRTVPVRSTVAVQPAPVRSTVPVPVSVAPPAPVPVRSPYPVPVRSAIPLRSPVPAPVRSPSPAPVRSPAPMTVLSSAPASVRPTPTPVRSKKTARKHRRHTPVHSPAPSPSPTPSR